MQGDRIVNPSSDTYCAKMRLQCLALCHANHIQMVDALRPCGFLRNDDLAAYVGKKLMIAMGQIPARIVPFRQMSQFYREPSRLNGIEPPVVTLDVVVILSRLPMISDHLHPFRQGFVICRDCPALTTGSKVFARIKTECRRKAHRAGFPPGTSIAREIFSPMSLASVFDDH